MQLLRAFAYLAVILMALVLIRWIYIVNQRTPPQAELHVEVDPQWSASEITDPITDAPRLSMSNIGTASLKRSHMIIGCEGGRVWAYVSSPAYIGVGDASVEFRAGKHPYRSLAWEVVKGQGVRGSLNGPMMLEMLGSEELLLRISPEYSTGYLARHDLTGLRDHRELIKTHCHT